MRSLLACALALFCIEGALAEARKPPLPPGRDPGGVAIALLTTGIDYTQPEVAQVLARDGEGELIGRDIADDDNRPRAVELEARANWGGDGTALAKALGSPGRRLVPVRISPGDPMSLARAVAFVAQTPARIVVPVISSACESPMIGSQPPICAPVLPHAVVCEGARRLAPALTRSAAA